MIDINKAIFNPSSVFQSPKQILDETTLSRDEKILALQNWEADELELLVAQEENMSPTDAQESKLSEIQRALLQLGVVHHHTPPTKQG